MKKNRMGSRLILALCFFFLYAPILVLMVFSFNSSKSRAVWTGFTFDWYIQLFHNEEIISALGVTLAVSTLAAILATVLGTAAAIGFSNMKGKFKTVCLSVNNIPLTNADIITGVSMMLLFTLGLTTFNGTLGKMLGISLEPGFGTLLIAHITFDVPYVVLSVMPKLGQLDPNIYEAAQDLGDHGFHAFRKVVLPEIMPGVVNGLLLSFTLSIDDFVISFFTAGARIETLSMYIYSMARRRISPEINALSTLMFVAVVALMVVINLRQTREDRLAKKRRQALTAQG